MSGYIGYRDGGKTNEEGLHKFLNRNFTAGVPLNKSATSLQVVQRGAGANLSVDVSIGDAFMTYPSDLYGLWGWLDAATNQVLTTANVTNPRIDVIGVYVDLSVVSTATNNNTGAFKTFVSTGTAAASPVANNDATIQAALGATTPFIKLATVLVAANATSITNANITDVRTAISSISYAGANTVLSTSIAQNAVQADDLATNTITLGYTQITANPANFSSTSAVQLTGLSQAVTVPSGGRRIEIVAFVPYIQAGASLVCGVSIWDGVVGVGTKVAEQDFTIPTAGYAGYNVSAIQQPSAGAKTYNVGIAVSTNAVTVNASATNPAFILVRNL